MEKVVVVGASGLLGSSLCNHLKNNGFKVVTVARNSITCDYRIKANISSELDKVLEIENPDYIVNLAALTNVDKCEEDYPLAEDSNSEIPKNIAHSEFSRAFVIHISTDHIYDKPNSKEEDIILLNNYAKSKLQGEYQCDMARTVVLRTNFFGRSQSDNSSSLCDEIYNKVKRGDHLKLFNDVFFSPVSIKTLCHVILTCIDRKITGIYNVGSKGGMSKELFLKTFLNKVGFRDFLYESVSVDSLDLDVTRPKDMTMDVSLFEKVYGFDLPLLLDEIESVADEFR